MKKLGLFCFVLINCLSSFAQSSDNREVAIDCHLNYTKFVNKLKEDNYLIDVYYNKFYRNLDNPGQSRYEGNSQISWDSFFYNSEKTRSTAQVDENSGLIYLITETDTNIRLKIFHPIIGPMQFSFDEENGFLFLPSQTKKVRLVSRKSPSNVGYTLRVRKEDGFTELEDWLQHLYDREIKYTSIIDYPDDSNLNTFYVTRSVLDEKLTTEKEYKYFPSYQEKLRLYYSIGLPKIDLENPNFFILKTDLNEIYKKEVWGRKGERHYLNDCFDGLQSSFGHFFIFKRDGKFGIMNARTSTFNEANPILIENIYDDIIYIQGTEYFMAESNGIKKKVDVNGNVVDNP